MSFTLRVLASGLARPARRLRYSVHRDQVAEVFLPERDPRGLVVTLHGGWWQARRTRTKLYMRPAALDLVERGFAVLNAEYRRVGDGGGWPATLDDARAIVSGPGLASRSLGAASATTASTPPSAAAYNARCAPAL